MPLFTSSAQSSQSCSRQSSVSAGQNESGGRHAAARAEHGLDHDARDVRGVQRVEEDVVADEVDRRVAAAARAADP